MIFSIHKRYNKTDTETDAKVGIKKGTKAPRGGYHLFLKELFDKMAGEDQRKYQSVVSRIKKKIKKDFEKLNEYNNRTKQMKNKAEKVKPTESRVISMKKT